MAVIIPFNPMRFRETPFSCEDFANDPHCRPRARVSIKADSEGSGQKIVEMLLPPDAAWSAMEEFIDRFMTIRNPAKAKPRRAARRTLKRRRSGRRA